MWSLHPGDSRAQRISLGRPRRARGDFKRYPRVPRKMMRRCVPAPVAVVSQSRGAFFEWLAQQIHSADYKRERFQGTFTAAAFRTGLMGVHFGTTFLGG